MTRIFIPLILISLAAACSQSDNQPSDIDLVVRCGVMIDGLAEGAVEDKLIVIRNQRISQILPGDDASMADEEVLDLSDHTCLPGLIDMHVHLDGYPEDADDYTIYLRRTPDDTQRVAEELAGIVLNAGFTTVRNVGT